MQKHLMAIAVTALLLSLPHASFAKDAADKPVIAEEVQDGEEAMTLPAEDTENVMPDVEQPQLDAKEKSDTDKSDAETQGEEE